MKFVNIPIIHKLPKNVTICISSIYTYRIYKFSKMSKILSCGNIVMFLFCWFYFIFHFYVFFCPGERYIFFFIIIIIFIILCIFNCIYAGFINICVFFIRK